MIISLLVIKTREERKNSIMDSYYPRATDIVFAPLLDKCKPPNKHTAKRR